MFDFLCLYVSNYFDNSNLQTAIFLKKKIFIVCLNVITANIPNFVEELHPGDQLYIPLEKI